MRPEIFFESFDWNSLLLEHWFVILNIFLVLAGLACIVISFELVIGFERWADWRRYATLQARRKFREERVVFRMKLDRIRRSRNAH